MDVGFRDSRFHSSRHLSAMQAARLNSGNHFSVDDYEGDDDVWTCFPCPFCYVDIEVPVLCAHLQEEHCFNVKNALQVCPLCAANLGRDMIGHFTMQHSNLLKRRRKSQRSGQWANSSVMLGNERELSYFLGITSTNGRGSTTDSAPDPLLSPFLSSTAHPDTKGDQDTSASKDLSTSSDMKSTEPSTSAEFQKQDYKERSQRVEFFQQLILSTIF